MAAAATAGFIGVALGAFGAHGLQQVFEERGTTAIWHTAIQYWFYHALALFALGLAGGVAPKVRRRTAFCWLAGMGIFSGSLFALAGFGPRWLGAITPIGGVLLLAGWAILLAGLLRRSNSKQ